ncbi:MAG: EamA family transporter [Lachnospiraceae bacterium]|nr:EamA family transporter [Lachnospiraceae bacterium]
MNRFKNSRLMMIFSMTIFGTLGVFVRNIPVSSGELVLYRAVLATLSYYFAPVIVTVVCPFLFKEKLSGKQILCFLMSTVGLLHTGITYCLYFSALKELLGQKAAILSYIDPLVAVVISVTVLREKMTVWQAVGGLLILGFTLWNEMKQK